MVLRRNMKMPSKLRRVDFPLECFKNEEQAKTYAKSFGGKFSTKASFEGKVRWVLYIPERNLDLIDDPRAFVI